IKLIRVSLGTVRHPRRFKIVVIDIQITLKQMLRDFIGIRVNRAKKSGMVRSEERFSRNAETDLVCRLLLEKKKATNGRSTGLALIPINDLDASWFPSQLHGPLYQIKLP